MLTTVYVSTAILQDLNGVFFYETRAEIYIFNKTTRGT